MKINGSWSVERVWQYLDETVIPARIAVMSPSGTPLVLSLWFMQQNGSIWCACNKRAKAIEWLRKNPRCGFEIASEMPPYRGVRGQGTAQLDASGGAGVLAALLARYRIVAGSQLDRMLMREAANEVAIRIDPEWITSWDFSARMADATGT